MKLFFAIILFGAAALLLLGAISRAADEFDAAASAAASSSAVLPHARIAKKIAAMPLGEKIGQMLMVAIPDAVLSVQSADWLRTHHIGGVILLGQNIRSREQTETLIRDLRDKARDSSDPPLLIAADQEGGAISRFRFLEELTAQKDIVAPQQAFDIGVRRARELRALGVNVNFSPVLDVASSSKDFIYSRAYRGNAEVVGMDIWRCHDSRV